MTKNSKWKLVTSYPIEQYACGVSAGQKVRLIKEVIVRNHKGEPTGLVHKTGEIWAVLSGASEPPIVVWLRTPNGDRCTWSNNASFFEYFEIVGN